jgi:hypothetical protein
MKIMLNDLSKMKKIIFLITIILAISGCSNQYNQDNQKDDIQKTGFKMESIDEKWNLYTNYDVGFSIKLPKKDDYSGEIGILKDKDEDIFYIWSHKDIISKKYNRIFDLNTLDRPIIDTYKIIFKKNIKNDNDLENFIKERYGEYCSLGEKQKTSYEDTIDVMIDKSSWTDFDHDNNEFDPKDVCFLNYATQLKYFPSKKMIATWNIGQAVNFMIDGEGVDEEISDSFHFIY